MKDTEVIRLMTDFIVNCHDSSFIKKEAKKIIDQKTEQMDREAEQKAIKAEQMIEATSASVGGGDSGRRDTGHQVERAGETNGAAEKDSRKE